MMNERGEQVDDVGPGYPVEVLGLSGVPVAGDEFNVVEDEKSAKEVATHRAEKARQKELGSAKKATLEDLFAKAKSGGGKTLNVVVKADVQGSSEAVTQALQKAATKKVGVKILDSGVGAVTESDVLTAAAGKAIIVGFNTKPETKVEQIASQQGVKILLFDIIYEAVDKVREEMAALLDPIIKEKPLGKAEVRALFNIPKLGAIAGSAVTEGVVKRAANVRVLRDRKVDPHRQDRLAQAAQGRRPRGAERVRVRHRHRRLHRREAGRRARGVRARGAPPEPGLAGRRPRELGGLVSAPLGYDLRRRSGSWPGR